MLNTTAFTLILPYLEQTTLANAYNFSQASSNSAWQTSMTDGGPSNTTLLGSQVVNSTVVGALVSGYICPSDIPPALYNGTGTYAALNAMSSNYFVSSANYTEYNCPGGFGQGLPNPPLRGAFYNDISTDFAAITDGLSNTFLAGETLSPAEHFNTYYGPFWGAGFHTSTHGEIYPPSSSIAIAFAPNGYTNAIYAPGTITNVARQKLPYAWVFGSKHPGGVNMLMGDGSVRFIKNSISLYTWWASATIAGSEIISSDAY